jgi:hypothetical protein
VEWDRWGRVVLIGSLLIIRSLPKISHVIYINYNDVMLTYPCLGCGKVSTMFQAVI